ILFVKIFMIIILYMVATNSVEILSFQPITDTDYVLMIDSSSSMGKTDLSPNRLTSAKDLSGKWLNILPNSTSVGIVSFSKGIDSYIKPTFERNLLKARINTIEIDYSKSGTDLDYAINFGVDLLNGTKQNKAILLFTDGTQEIRDQTIFKAKDQRVKIFAFGIGGTDTTTLDDVPEEFKATFQTQDLNFTILETLSNKTNGKAYKITNQNEFEESFRTATLEQVKISMNSGYYVTILIAAISIIELLIYAKLGAL
ncbi:MAG: VWA domain-containing protein, partial [Nanoarchaeota archaeon]|nr:VWA domain-containing protein [Nanoarchaeota archaeon]